MVSSRFRTPPSNRQKGPHGAGARHRHTLAGGAYPKRTRGRLQPEFHKGAEPRPPGGGVMHAGASHRMLQAREEAAGLRASHRRSRAHAGTRPGGALLSKSDAGLDGPASDKHCGRRRDSAGDGQRDALGTRVQSGEGVRRRECGAPLADAGKSAI